LKALDGRQKYSCEVVKGERQKIYKIWRQRKDSHEKEREEGKIPPLHAHSSIMLVLCVPNKERGFSTKSLFCPMNYFVSLVAKTNP